MNKKLSFKKLLKMVLLLPLLPIIGVTGGEGGAAAGDDGKKPDGDGKLPDEELDGKDDKTPPDKTHTQADVDKAVKDRVSREQKKYEKMINDMKKTMGGEEGAGTPPAGADGEPTGIDPAIQKATDQLLMANTRLVQATALSEAIKLGVDPKYTADVVRLAEMSAIEVGDDGTMDTAAISKAIDAVIKRVPVFKQSAENAGGFKVGGEGQKGAQSKDGWGSPKKQETNGVSNSKRWNNQNR